MTFWQDQNLSEDDQKIWDYYDGRCVVCGEQAVTIHEISPKSLNPRWREFDNRVPLCNECHDWAHSIGTRHSASEIERKQEQWKINHKS